MTNPSAEAPTPASTRSEDTAMPDRHAGEPGFDLTSIVQGLRGAREQWRRSQQRSLEAGGRELPSREALAEVLDGLRGALFPMRLGPPDLRQETEDYYVGHTLDRVLHSLLAQVRLELRHTARSQPLPNEAVNARATRIVRAFGAALLACTAAEGATGSAKQLALSRAACQQLIEHVPDQDATYLPGKTADGRDVVPADLDDGRRVELPNVIPVLISKDLQDEFHVPFDSPLFDANAGIGLLVYDSASGVFTFNGAALDDPELRLLAAQCRAAGAGPITNQSGRRP